MKVFGVLALGFREANAKYLRGFVSALTNVQNLNKSCRKENEKGGCCSLKSNLVKNKQIWSLIFCYASNATRAGRFLCATQC